MLGVIAVCLDWSFAEVQDQRARAMATAAWTMSSIRRASNCSGRRGRQQRQRVEEALEERRMKRVGEVKRRAAGRTFI
jgi:hypothetical protein